MNILPYLINPVLSASIIAIVFSVAILIAVIKHQAVISSTLGQVGAKIFTRAGFFWMVNLIFMAVSVLHAGIFFGITGNGHDLPGMAQYLGFAVSFFLDLVTIILMQAMLEARYRGEASRARQFLLFITICCATSTFANLAISLNDFDARLFLPHAPLWIQAASPYVLASFPLFVIMMSLAAEMIINVRPLESLEEDEYEADEKKRLRILQIRNTYLEKQAEEDLRALTIRAQMRATRQLQKGRLPNAFRWFWEKPPEVDAVVAGVTAHLKGVYEPQIADLQRRLEEMQRQMNSRHQNVAQWWQNVEPVENHSSVTAGLAAVGSALYPMPKQESNDGTSGLVSTTDLSPTGVLAALKTKERSELLDRQKTGPIQSSHELMEVVKRYPKVASAWVQKGVKSVSVDEIVEVTGHAKRRLSKAPFQRTARNKDLILVSSVIEWLRTAPLPSSSDSFPVVPEMSNGRDKVLLTSQGSEIDAFEDRSV